MNGRTLFELIGTVDDQMLEHSEWTAPKRRHNFKMKKALILIAAVIAALAVTVTAAAVSEGTNLLGLILGGFYQDEDRTRDPDQDVIQEQIEEGEWIYLNGDNVGVIVPESPVKIMLSSDGGKTWKESIVCGSDEMEIYGDLRGFTCYGGYIGFFGESGGYLVLTGGVSMNNQPMRIYLTDDGGNTWSEIGNPYSRYIHISVLTGAGFSTPEIGFISYRYFEDAGPDIWWTADGGDTWQKLMVTIPEEYASYMFTPQTPTFDGKDGVYPIAYHRSGEVEGTVVEGTVYMYSHDYGLTWKFEQ